MITIVSANQKGGTGKTATIIHLAFAFAKRELSVVFVDLDTQGNASYTLSEFTSGIFTSQLFDKKFTVPEPAQSLTLIESDTALANIEKMSISKAGKSFHSAIQDLGVKYDVCLIDTPPSLGIGLTSALLAADYVYSPVELEAYSIQGIKKMMITISSLRRLNRHLTFLGILPSKVDARNPRHVRHLTELREAYPKLILPVNIGLRSSVADALATGVPVWKIKKTAARKAGKEMRSFAEYVYSNTLGEKNGSL